MSVTTGDWPGSFIKRQRNGSGASLAGSFTMARLTHRSQFVRHKRINVLHSGQMGGSIHDTSSGPGSGLGGAVAPSASAISLANVFQQASQSWAMRSMRPRLDAVGLALPQRSHAKQSRSDKPPMCSSVVETDRIWVGCDLASPGQPHAYLNPPPTSASIPSAVGPHIVERAWFMASRWSAPLYERPGRHEPRLLGSAWVDGGRDGSTLRTPPTAGTRERRHRHLGA
jgi:hypothetical protein